jgi:cytochrome c556
LLKSKFLAGLSVVTGLAVAAAGLSATHDMIVKRKEAMQVPGAATELSNEMIKGEKPYDPKAAGEPMNRVATSWGHSSKSFPTGTETGGETTSAPMIWEDFKEAAREAAKGPAAFKAAFGDLGKTCKSCPDLYGIPKE